MSSLAGDSAQPDTIELKERLRSRPLAVSEVARIHWNDLTPAALDAFRAFAAGTSPINGGSYLGLVARDAFGMNVQSGYALYY